MSEVEKDLGLEKMRIKFASTMEEAILPLLKHALGYNT